MEQKPQQQLAQRHNLMETHFKLSQSTINSLDTKFKGLNLLSKEDVLKEQYKAFYIYKGQGLDNDKSSLLAFYHVLKD